MTLTTHAVVGASLAALIPSQPALGFAVGFVSHFLLDAIPHWDYHLKASHENKEDRLQSTLVFTRDTIIDLVKIGFDGFLGLFLPFFFFMPQSWPLAVALLCGAFGGMLPDGLQFVYYQVRREPITSLQRFHQYIHAETRLKDYWIPGLTIQVAIIVAVYAGVVFLGVY